MSALYVGTNHFSSVYVSKKYIKSTVLLYGTFTDSFYGSLFSDVSSHESDLQACYSDPLHGTAIRQCAPLCLNMLSRSQIVDCRNR